VNIGITRIDGELNDDRDVNFKGDCAKFIVQSSDMSHAVVQGRYIFVRVTRSVGGVLLSMSYHGNLQWPIICDGQLLLVISIYDQGKTDNQTKQNKKKTDNQTA